MVRVYEEERLEGLKVHESGSPFCTVDFVELFKHDLNFLAIGRVLGDEMKTLVQLVLASIDDPCKGVCSHLCVLHLCWCCIFK